MLSLPLPVDRASENLRYSHALVEIDSAVGEEEEEKTRAVEEEEEEARRLYVAIEETKRRGALTCRAAFRATATATA